MVEEKSKIDPLELEHEIREWRESLSYVIAQGSRERVLNLLEELDIESARRGVPPRFTANTPYINSIPPEQQATYPGNRDLEKRIRSTIRWNAMAMVVRANRREDGIGGHISSYASAATLYEVGFNHFFRARTADFEGDLVYIQGHASPGIYARAFLEGRLSEDQLNSFRRELTPGGGLSSYPHPRLMPDFWQFATVSMGLGPITAIYHARFRRYLEDRGFMAASNAKIWAFLGDGETDEPETLGAITLAAREKLDNLIFVVNCNLQRLDGPVRGNGKIIQELEAAFRGAGWNVIKVIWGSDWDELLARDKSGLLVKRMGEVVDGEYQKYVTEGGAYIRKHFFGKYPELLKLVENHSDDQLSKLNRGGHDIRKVYAAYQAAMQHRDQPTVILAKTIKGYGLGEAGEGKNITHQQKKLGEDELRNFRTRFGIPISDDEIARAPFYKPADDSAEMQYLRGCRERLGGALPARIRVGEKLIGPDISLYEEFFKGSEGRPISTTMAFVRLLTKLLQHETFGKYVVPIVPDEARTFGMDALFRQCGIYSHVGQLYEPVDRDQLLYYKETQNGQILEEGITEAGSMASLVAAGTAYSVYGKPMVPFFIYYSMFGMQRIGDQVWAAGDMRTRGFMLGATAGRTTLNGEGLQHQDGHSLLLAETHPHVIAYEPAFAYEIALIVREGLRRMHENNEDVIYYITLQNENYPMLPLPIGCEAGVLGGIYKLCAADKSLAGGPRVDLLGSGSIINEVLRAQDILRQECGVAADVWCVTSYGLLRREALHCERENLLNLQAAPRVPFITQALTGSSDIFIASSDWMKALPDGIARWLPGKLTVLGTDGFGCSDSRAALRDHFEIDARYIALAALQRLVERGDIPLDKTAAAMTRWGIDAHKRNPMDLV